MAEEPSSPVSATSPTLPGTTPTIRTPSSENLLKVSPASLECNTNASSCLSASSLTDRSSSCPTAASARRLCRSAASSKSHPSRLLHLQSGFASVCAAPACGLDPTQYSLWPTRVGRSSHSFSARCWVPPDPLPRPAAHLRGPRPAKRDAAGGPQEGPETLQHPDQDRLLGPPPPRLPGRGPKPYGRRPDDPRLVGLGGRSWSGSETARRAAGAEQELPANQRILRKLRTWIRTRPN